MMLPAEVEALRAALFTEVAERAAAHSLPICYRQAAVGAGPEDSGIVLRRAAFAKLADELQTAFAKRGVQLLLPGRDAGDPDIQPRLVVDGTTMEDPARADLACHQGVSLRLLLLDRLPSGRLVRLQWLLAVDRVQTQIERLIRGEGSTPASDSGSERAVERAELRAERASDRSGRQLAAAFARRAAQLSAIAGDPADVALPDWTALEAERWMILPDGLLDPLLDAPRHLTAYAAVPEADYSDWWFDVPAGSLLP